MKIGIYGLVFFLSGALSLPANMEDSRKENAKIEEIKNTINFPQNIENIKESMEKEMEITPRISEEPKNVVKKDLKETVQEILAIDEKSPQEQIPLSLVIEKDPQIVEDSPKDKKEILDFQTTLVMNSTPQVSNVDSTMKPLSTWNDFEDGKFSLLENRLPDLTEDEYKEINKEGSIPLNFLKDLKEIKVKDSKVKTEDDKLPMGGTKPETPVYITIPIVINSNSNLPISLNIGGHTIPLDTVKTMTSMVTPLGTKLDYTSPPIRETNRHRGNLGSEIFARSS